MKTRSGFRYRTPALYGSALALYNNRAIRNRTARRNRYAASRTVINRRRQTSGVGVTGQYDRRLVYRKKSMPRFKKRRWKRFKNRVNAVSEKDLGTNTILFNHSVTALNATSGNQCVKTLALYSSSGTGDILDDLNYIGLNGNTGSTVTASSGIGVAPSTKFLFQSGILDVTIQNTSSFTTVSGEVTSVTYPSECKMEVDVYEVYVRKESTYDDSGSGTVVIDDFDTMLNFSSVYEYPIPDNTSSSTTTEITINKRGATPFDCVTALSRFGIKVMKKTKFMLAQGETITYQVRDPKRHVYEKQKLISQAGFNFPGLTKVIFIIGKLTPQCTPIGVGNNYYQERLTIGATRKYMYKVEGQNDSRSLYVN